MTFKAMGEIVGAHAPAHPAVRYNAILIIGQLDRNTPERQPPEPLPAAEAADGIVNSATTDKRFPPSVILGAIIGLDRHAQYQSDLRPRRRPRLRRRS